MFAFIEKQCTRCFTRCRNNTGYLWKSDRKQIHSFPLFFLLSSSLSVLLSSRLYPLISLLSSVLCIIFSFLCLLPPRSTLVLLLLALLYITLSLTSLCLPYSFLLRRKDGEVRALVRAHLCMCVCTYACVCALVAIELLSHWWTTDEPRMNRKQ